jgi:hypothetical protein
MTIDAGFVDERYTAVEAENEKREKQRERRKS